MRRLPDVVVAVHEALEGADIPHAVGGAIALGYHAEPRGTVEVDLDVFLPPREAQRVVAALEPVGVTAPSPEAIRGHPPVAGVRFDWDGVPIDVFMAFDDEYFVSVANRVVRFPFADSTGVLHELPFISAEDLSVFKIRCDRPKDWVDIQSMLDAGPLDTDYVGRWLLHLGGEHEWPRLRRFLDLAGRL